MEYQICAMKRKVYHYYLDKKEKLMGFHLRNLNIER
jgi:hypothetical protein